VVLHRVRILEVFLAVLALVSLAGPMGVLNMSLYGVSTESLVTVLALNPVRLASQALPVLSYRKGFSREETLLQCLVSLINTVIPSQVVLETRNVFADFITMLTLHRRGVAMNILHVTRYRVSVDELVADFALDFIGI
jgi:hypothetical protein